MRGKKIMYGILIGFGVGLVYDLGKKMLPSIFV